MARWIVCVLLVLILGAPAVGCDKPASGEGYFFVVRTASFVYDFAQHPAMAYGDIDIQVTHTQPISQLCLACSKSARDGQLQFAVVGHSEQIQPKRLNTLHLQSARVDTEGEVAGYVLPIAPTPPQEHVKLYIQAPIASLADLAVGGGRLKTMAPGFLVPCDTIGVRLNPPPGELFQGETVAGSGEQHSGSYHVRGLFTGPELDRADEGIAHALYANRRENERLPDGGYYYKTVQPLERIVIVGRLESVQREQGRRLLLIGGAIVGAAAACAIVWLLASASARHRDRGTPGDLPT